MHPDNISELNDVDCHGGKKNNEKKKPNGILHHHTVSQNDVALPQLHTIPNQTESI